MKITTFTGINNVIPEERLLPDAKHGTSALREAMNVDIGLEGEAMRRQGLTRLQDSACSWVWEGVGFTLAVVAGDLVAVVDGSMSTLQADVGSDRMWYSNWPDGRTAFTNGTVSGLARSDGVTGWGNPNPDLTSVVATPGTSGELRAGGYRYALSYKRTSDKFEGGMILSDSIAIADGGSLALTNLPTLSGYSINVYLTHHNGESFRLAGNTTDDTFTYTGAVDALIRVEMTANMDGAPAGILAGWWRGRALVANGNVLWASKYLRPEHFELEKDFKQFAGDIRFWQPVQEGIFVGTTEQLMFLRGTNWDELALERTIAASCVLGSGVTVPGRYLKRGDTTAGQGDCMLAIANGNIVAGYQDGAIEALTQGVYSTDATEVSATFRLRGEIPQYIAVPV